MESWKKLLTDEINRDKKVNCSQFVTLNYDLIDGPNRNAKYQKVKRAINRLEKQKLDSQKKQKTNSI